VRRDCGQRRRGPEPVPVGMVRGTALPGTISGFRNRSRRRAKLLQREIPVIHPFFVCRTKRAAIIFPSVSFMGFVPSTLVRQTFVELCHREMSMRTRSNESHSPPPQQWRRSNRNQLCGNITVAPDSQEASKVAENQIPACRPVKRVTSCPCGSNGFAWVAWLPVAGMTYRFCVDLVWTVARVLPSPDRVSVL